ncbi:MAG: repeat/DnaJ protein, partial [Myxococcaceae bacterium]|nr:repeat/DnaJ protein [Myxococcaceae bacterium]
MSEPLQIWVRNDKGKVFGPLMPATVELLLDNGLIAGKVQVSLDGSNYVYPARMPEVRDSFPPELWGEGGPPVTSPALDPAPAPSKMPGGRPPTLGGPGAPAGRPPTLGGTGAPAGRPPTLGGAGVPAPAGRPPTLGGAGVPAPSVSGTAPTAGPGATAPASAP